MPFEAEPRFTGATAPAPAPAAVEEVVEEVEVEVELVSAPASMEGGGIGAPDPLRLLGALPLVKLFARAMGEGTTTPADSCFCIVES